MRLLPFLMSSVMMLLGIQDTPPRFHGVARVTVETSPGQFTECLTGLRVEDLGSGSKEFKNIFHLLLQTSCHLPESEGEFQFVTSTVAEAGSLLVKAGKWKIECYPMDEVIIKRNEEAFKRPVHGETRWQKVTVRRVGSFYEYLVEEPN